MIVTRPNRKELLILVATALLVLLPLIGLGSYVASKHMWAQARLSELEPRFARLRGLDLQREEIDESLERALQQKVRSLLTTAGLTVVSSQVLPAKEEKGFDRIPLSVRAEGDLLAVDSALAVLNEQLPVMLLTDVEVRNQGSLQVMNEKVAPRLSLQMTLSVLRERP